MTEAQTDATVVDTIGVSDDAQQALFNPDVDALVHTLAQKRKQIIEAKKEYSAAGSRVKTLQDDQEKIIQSLEDADARRQQPTFAAIHEAAYSEGVDDEIPFSDTSSSADELP